MAPKRPREDPNSYLGGDLPATVEFIEQSGDGPRREKLTKAERNEARKQANKKWKLVDRKVGSGKDPNPRHTLYYRTQLPELKLDEDWAKFQAALVDPLPVTFRFGNSCPAHVARSLKNRMDNEFRTMPGRFVEINGVVLKDKIVKPILWPGRNVWQIAADSTTLARNSGLSSLSTLLLREVELGHVVRQELASMIPALMLDVEGHHNVLDVCAAPGSKTEQLLSILQSKHRASADSTYPCPGMVVANDADPVRINTLKRRYARCGSPNLMVTCSRAEDLQKVIGRPVFDRIVADVPCSGDGTIRKFPHIWRLFRPRMSLELHLVQLQIAIASVQLLRPGGRMVYSTCSINPLEDEAVVAGLLRRFWGRLHLVDTKAEGLLPGLVTRPGLSHWECSEEVFSCGEPDEASRKASIARLPAFTQSMRPPTPEEARLMQLDRCHRVLPQDNDTGGFFVAVLHLLPAEAPTPTEYQAHPLPVEGGGSKRKKSSDGKEVSAEASMEIMRNLGYNPKHTTLKAGSSGKEGAGPAKKTPVVTATGAVGQAPAGPSKEGDSAVGQEDAVDRPVVYRLLDCQEGGAAVQGLQLDPSIVADHFIPGSAKASHHLVSTTVVPAQPASESEESKEEEGSAGAGIFGTKATGWVKKTASGSTGDKKKVGPTTRYCLVSQNVRAALDSWAGDTPVFLRQAGVAVADLVPASTGANQSRYRALPDAAQVLAACASKECVLAVAPADFKLVLKLALQEAETSGHDADITHIFEQLAVLTAPDFDPEGASLEGLSVEAAELQVALATGLSADALQALGDAHRQHSSSQGLMHLYLTCRVNAQSAAATGAPVAGAGTTAGPGAGAGAGAEKRRLSKAERKKIKAQSSASSSEVHPAEGHSGRAESAESGVADRGPEVLLLEVGGGAVRLRSAADLCRSYLDSV